MASTKLRSIRSYIFADGDKWSRKYSRSSPRNQAPSGTPKPILRRLTNSLGSKSANADFKIHLVVTPRRFM